jgi:hypothetical protein
MAQAAQPAPVVDKKKRTRSPSPPRVAFLVMQAVGNDGQPIPGFSKSNLKVLSVETNAETVLEKVDSGETQNAFYVRVVVPPRVAARPGQSAPKPLPAAA